MSKRFNHATHNEHVSNLLCESDDNVDWIITTAFYSALHFTEHKLFPMKYTDSKGRKFKIKALADYYSFVYPYGTPKIPNKHAVRLDLVNKNLPDIGPDYKWLKDTCYTARYVDYQFSNPANFIQEAKTRLSKVKAACV